MFRHRSRESFTLGLLLLMGGGLFAGCDRPPPAEYRVQYDKYWDVEPFLHKELIDRVALPSRELMDHLRFQNKKEGRPEPTVTGIGTKDLDIVRSALAKLPRKILLFMNTKVVTVSLVNDLGSSGYTNSVFNNEGFSERGFIVLDKKVLSESPNEWITRRESSPFKCLPMERVVAKLSAEKQGSESALQYILMHEFAHVFSEGTAINPLLRDTPEQSELDRRDFGPLSWHVVNSRYVSKFDERFPDRTRVLYYPVTPSSLSCADAVIAYSQLEKSNFPALYAVANPFEDFAESFANFVHVSVMKRPFEITIYRDEKIIKRYSSCWNESRCSEKKRYFEKMYADFKE